MDLRSNTGGDVWPMLGSIQPVLGSGVLRSFVSPLDPASVVRVTPTVFTQDREVVFRIPVALGQGASTDPVVILTGSITGSSGEFAAIAFRGRPCTSTMGSPTFGVPTGNTVFPLRDGAQLSLATAFDADRSGHVYADAPIAPT